MDERVGRVVGAAGFTLIARCDVQLEDTGLRIDERVQFEQPFIDAAEFLGAEILVVDRTASEPSWTKANA